MSFLSRQLQESEQHKASLDQQLREAQQQVKELQEKLVDSESSRATVEEISKELQEQVRGRARHARAPSPCPPATSRNLILIRFNFCVFSAGGPAH